MKVLHKINKFKVVISKSNSVSIICREKGNSFFKQLKIFDAILAYNQSIAFAESQFNIALAYGNRSAAYFEAKLYAESLKSIKLAKESGYPAEKMEKLIEREQKCLKLMVEQPEEDPADNLWSYIKLSYPANKKLPWMIEDLEVRQTEKYGRGIYTTRDLKAGDIICIEESKIQVAHAFYECCDNCAKTSMMNLIPCLKTASLMFCSIACRDDFYNYADMSTIRTTKIEVLLRKIEAAFGSWNKVNEYINQNPKTTIFDFNFSNKEDSNYWLNIYKCFLVASDYPIHQQHQNNEFNMARLVVTIVDKFFHNSIFVTHNDFANTVFNEDKLTSMNVVNTPNKHCFGTFRALLNNSCVPNVEHFWIDNYAVFYVQTPIKANEQLFVAYAGPFYEEVRTDRCEFLSELGVPNCDCMACVQNLTPDDVRAENPKELKYLNIAGTTIGDVGSVKSGMKRVAKLFDILNKYTNPLSLERAVANETIYKIYGILADRSIFPV